MAYPIELTIGTGNKVTINYQSQEVSVSLTYRLERGDTDALAVAREKAPEVIAIHRAAWESVRGVMTAGGEPIGGVPSGVKRSAAAAETCAASSEESATARCGSDEIGAQNSGPAGIDPASSASKGAAAGQRAGITRRGDMEPSTTGQRMAIEALLTQNGVVKEAIRGTASIRFGCESLDELNYSQACEWLLELQRAQRDRVKTHRCVAGMEVPSNGYVDVEKAG